MTRREIEEKIRKDFEDGVCKIFGDNLAFGFICGGFAKGFWDNNHDIDTFICVKKSISKETANEYLEWYYNLHKKHNFPPDDDYPGEIVELDVLQEKLKLLHLLKLELKVTNIDTREAILWADMLVGEKMGLVCNNRKVFDALQEEYVNYPEKWKNEVLSLVSEEDRQKWQDESYLLIMERFMQYPKNDARGFYRKYGLESIKFEVPRVDKTS
jgi:hypothetical protein